jgi:hypothetical protein
MAAKGGLTLANLTNYDDVCTDALVDRVRVAPRNLCGDDGVLQL